MDEEQSNLTETNHDPKISFKEKAKKRAKEQRQAYKNSPAAKALKLKAKESRKKAYEAQKGKAKALREAKKEAAKAMKKAEKQQAEQQKQKALWDMLRPASSLPPPSDEKEGRRLKLVKTEPPSS